MALRGHRGERTPIALRAGTAPGPEGWPAAFVTPPAEQVLLLARKQAGGPGGRIPLPRSAIDLWAHHKYSVMARDPAAYREIGRRLARRLPEDAFVPLIEELVAFLRVPPSAGRILNAIEHMWGHVSRHASPEEAAAALTGGAAALLATTQSLATRHGERFLLASTALSDLAAWF
jgi:hypothetical protein